MPIEGYGAFDDPYIFKGTKVLKNRLGIRDPAILQAFEVEMSSLRAEEPLPVGYFDAAQYRKRGQWANAAVLLKFDSHACRSSAPA